MTPAQPEKRAALVQLVEAAGRELADLVALSVVAALAEAPQRDGQETWRLLSVAEAAERLGRSQRWVRERARDGSLPHVRLDGGALAFELADVRAFAGACRIDVRGESAIETPVPPPSRLTPVRKGWDS